MLFRPEEIPIDIRDDPSKVADFLTGALFFIVHNFREVEARVLERDWVDWHENSYRDIENHRYSVFSQFGLDRLHDRRN